MLARGLTSLALCALLCGCGGPKKSFDDSFNKNFHEKFVGSCVKSATDSGLSQELAGKLCTCASDKVKERFSVREKMNLKDQQLRPILEECRASIPG
ncbi:MAG TPA: hypothetical protein VHE36_00110 [Sphingomicrobium sp.]|jgi:hypothetical protein|nr:hypothetical protein [Sphingomicrobium sp.]